MNVYQKILRVSGLNLESNDDGRRGALYVLLNALNATDGDTVDTLGNPVDELLKVRLAPWAENPFVKEYVAPFVEQFRQKLA